MMNHNVVAVVQSAPPSFDTDGTMRKISTICEQAHAEHAKLVVFPEAFLGGYPKGLDFGARVGLREPRGRDEFVRYHQASVTLPGTELTTLCKLAQRLSLHIVMGCIERDGGTLYCSTLFIDSHGQFLGKHRKTMPTAMERLIWGFGDGSMLPVVQTEIGRIGSVICWENYMPLLRTNMYSQGVELYCASTVDDRDSWIPSMQHIATEGRCFVLSACQYAKRSDYPEDYDCIQGDDPDTVLIRGGSCIVSPFGELLAGPIYDQETILTAEIDMEEIVKGKFDLDITGHYARPDIFSLTVNTQPQLPVKRKD